MRLLYPYGEEFTGERAREVHTINRAHSLAECGMDVTLVVAESPRFNSGEQLLRHFGLLPSAHLKIEFLPRRLRLGPMRFVSTKMFYRRLGGWLKHQPPFDVVYLIHLKAADYLETEHSHLPVVFEAHEIFADSFPTDHPKHTRVKELEDDVYSRARAIVATSNFLLSALEERYPIPTKTNVIPNAVESSFFEVPLDRAEPRRIVYIGSFQHWKGVDVALTAMRDLGDYKLDLFGGTAEQGAALKATAPPNVYFHGYARHDQILPTLAKASVALIPNLLEPKSSLYTFPMKLLEYAAAGRMVVSSDLPVVRELHLGDWAQIVPAGNSAALADAIRNQDQLRTAPLQEDARAWARGFTWERGAEILKCFLEEL
jgi:glycosyltransferase involved in cell wall biosynthesis